MIIVEDNDMPAILDIAEDRAKRIKGARKVVLRDAAHHLKMEKPAEFNRTLLEFLKNI